MVLEENFLLTVAETDSFTLVLKYTLTASPLAVPEVILPSETVMVPPFTRSVYVPSSSLVGVPARFWSPPMLAMLTPSLPALLSVL